MSEENTQEDQATPSVEELLAEIRDLKAKVDTKDENVAQPTNDKVKENIGKAYEERDAMATRVKELEEEKRQAELRALEEAGKKEEADKMRMDELKKQLQDSNDRITSLTRDNAVAAALGSLEFVSDKATAIAQRDIVGSLVQNANGEWVSPTGQPISDYVQFYSNDDANKFLFKVKQSSGSESMSGKTTSTPISTSKSITDMSDAEMIEAAANGQFDGGKLWI